MSEGKDPGIKLFGKTIQVPEISLLHPDSSPLPPSVYHLPDLPSSPFSKTEDASSEQEADKDSFGKELTDSKEKDGTQALKSEDISDSKTSSLKHENSEKPSSVDNEVETVKSSKTEEEHSETSNSEEKTLKKPDKILPCPRCNSMDTKFCYYNNYNVNQPRHFCKKCQRYWTAGGTMRNVPVGAGRRKNKNLASQYHHHMSVSEALQSTCVDGPHHPTMNVNGTVLAFGEPRSTVTVRTCTQNDGFHKAEELKRSVPHVDNGDDLSSGSSITAANSKDEMCQIGLQDPRLNFAQQVQCFPGAPWPYPWTSPQWNSAVAPPGYPMPFYPVSPYWATTVPPGSWNLQWVPQPAASSMLGKHSREDKEMSTSREEPEKENNHEKCLWFPKTMRVDEPGEESRISLWATLGFQNDQADCVRGGSLFKAFKSKGEEKTRISESSLVLNANPAALSRSLNFHESS